MSHGAIEGTGKVHPSRLKLSAALGCRCWQLGPAVNQVDPPGSYPMLQPAGVVSLRSVTSENPMSRSIDTKNVSGSWEFFKRSCLDGQNRCD